MLGDQPVSVHADDPRLGEIEDLGPGERERQIADTTMIARSRYGGLWAPPTTSAELRRCLEGLYAQDNGADSGTSGRSTLMLTQAGNLVTMSVKPAVRAAAYRVMADLPGVRVVRRVTEPAGHEGVGVEFPRT